MDEILADQNFPEVEKDFIRRRAHPKFDWVRFDEPSGINPLTKPLGEARVAVVSTAGAHCRSDPPFNLKSPIGDPTYREIPKNADLRDILLSHIGYDVREVSADKNSVFPLDRLHELEADGVIGSLGPRLFSFMGYVAETDPLVGEAAPEVVAKLKEDRVDLVILAPA